MWERVRRFNSLPRPAKSLFLRAALLYPCLSLSLKLRGFQATLRSLQNRLLPHRQNLPDPDAAVALTVRMVLAAGRHSLIRPTCLEQSLSLWWLLDRQGIASQLRIGVRKQGERFAAHAWVERGGIAIGESESPHLHYAAFAEGMSGDIT